MKTEKNTKRVGSILGLITLILAKLVVPMPTTNRWLTKMGNTTDNLLSYGLINLERNRLERSLYQYSLSLYR